jgi:hypothetical protein
MYEGRSDKTGIERWYRAAGYRRDGICHLRWERGDNGSMRAKALADYFIIYLNQSNHFKLNE